MVQLKFRPPTLKEKDWVVVTNQLLNNAEITEPAEGLRTEDQLQKHLEEYCLNRVSKVGIQTQKKIYQKVVHGQTMVIIILYLINFITII